MSHLFLSAYVMSVIAKDPDAGENGTVVYEILQSSTQYASYFKIDRKLGEIRTNTNPDNLDRLV